MECVQLDRLGIRQCNHRPQPVPCIKVNGQHTSSPNHTEVWIFEGPNKRLTKYKVPVVRENEPLPDPAPVLPPTRAPKPEDSAAVLSALKSVERARAQAASRLQELAKQIASHPAGPPPQSDRPQRYRDTSPTPIISPRQRRIVPRPPGTKGSGRVPSVGLEGEEIFLGPTRRRH